jgi:hypothetical protein
MATTVPISSGQVITLGDSITAGPWRFYADPNGQDFRLQTYLGGTSFQDNGLITVPSTTEWSFLFEDVAGPGDQKQASLLDSNGNRAVTWIAEMTDVSGWALRGLDPSATSVPPNFTLYNMMSFGSEEIVTSLTGNGIIICFHPNCDINGKLARHYRKGDSFPGENGPVKIIDIIHFGAPEVFVSFPPDCFQKGVPRRELIVTKGHYVKHGGDRLPAIIWHDRRKKGRLINCQQSLKTVHFITDGPEILNFINCNGLLVDTMGASHPWYKKLKQEGFRNSSMPFLKGEP